MLELEVCPGHGLCSDQIEFVLGMHFSQAVAAIQSLVGSIKDVQILYSDEDPLNTDLGINLTSDGIKLVFDPVNQRLKNIDVYDMSRLRLKYSDVLFNCPEVAPTIDQIDQTFGATHPGEYDNETRVFTLTFRGLAFEFPADTKFQPSFAGLRQKLGRLQFPPGESPRVARMSIYSGSSTSECSAPALPTPRYPALFQEGVEILRRQHRETLGLRVRLLATPTLTSQSNEDSSTSGSNPVISREIFFGDSVQDIVSTVGAPARIFYKSEDKMRIHAPAGQRRTAQSQKSDYFYNYFTLGFDVLFDAKTNTAKKFVLHTNYPGHYNFNMHHRCQFQLPLNPVAASSQHLSNNPHNTSSSQQQQGLISSPGGKGMQGFSSLDSDDAGLTVTAFSKWDDVGSRIKASERPVVLNRASSTNTTNPFGSTFCYGYQDIIFEVMANGHLGGITLYDSQGGSANGGCGRAAALRRRRQQGKELLSAEA